MRKLLITIVLAAMLLPAAAKGAGFTYSPSSANPPTQPFLPFYMITGTVTSSETAAAGKPVYFYRGDFNTTEAVSAASGADGQYLINAYDLAYFYNVPVAMDATTVYKLAVGRADANDWGTEESFSFDPAIGYLTKNLTVAAGEGPIVGVTTTTTTTTTTIITTITLPPHCVALSVARDTDNKVKVSWTVDTAPDIYALVGAGTGVFTNNLVDDNWKKIVSGGTIPALVSPTPGGFGSFTPDFTNKAIYHLNQVGKTTAQEGIPEVYYKAVEAGITEADRTTALPLTPTVGKFDVTVTQGYNAFSLPLIPSGTTPDIVFGLLQLSGSTLQRDADKILRLKETKNGYSQAYLYRDTAGNLQWRDMETDQATTMAVEPDIGYLIYIANASATVPLTVVGNVSTGPRAVSLTQGYNLVGTCFPKSVTVGDSAIAVGASQQALARDAIKILARRQAGGFYQMWLNLTAWQFDAIPGDPFNFQSLDPGKSYLIYENITGRTWTYPIPY